MKKTLFITSFLLGFSFMMNAQIENNYSFYNLQQSIENPAAAASYDQIYGAALFNAQMVGFEGAPIGGLVDFGIPINKANLTIGGQVAYENMGAFKRTDVGIQIAYRAKVGKGKYLSFGVTPFLQVAQTDFSKLRVVDNSDLQVGKNRFSNVSPNLRAGVFYFTKNFYTGLSVQNIFSQRLKDTEAYTEVNIKAVHFYYNIGYSWEFTRHWEFQPSAMLRIQGHAPLQLDINAQFLYKKMIGFGLSYRSKSTLVAQLNYTHNDLLRFGYAFNYGFNQQDRATNFSGHEIFVGFVLPYQKSPYSNEVKTQIPRF